MTIPLDASASTSARAAPRRSPPQPSAALAQPSDAAERLSALVPLTQNLANSVTCPICLEYMEKARQLQCGHLFCAECVVRMLAMRRVRCAVCKEKTGKRMVRSAPLPFADIVQNLRLLETIIDQSNIRRNRKENPALNDGFDAVINTTLARIQTAQRRAAAAPVPIAAPRSVQVAPARRVCVLCPDGVDPVSFGNDVLFGVLRRVAAEGNKQTTYAHEHCALYSAGVYEIDGEFENVDRLLANTRKDVCSREACGRTHAGVVCAHEHCDVRYHYPCAVVEGGVIIEDGYKVFCPKHKDHAPNIDEKDFEKSLSDPKGEMSLFHEDSCYLCRTGGRLLMCDTCERVTHPACSGLKAIPIGDWSCGVCTGVHKSPRVEEALGTPETKSAKRQSTSKRKRSDTGMIPDPLESGDRTGSATAAKRSRRASDGGRKYVLAHTGLQEPQRELLRGVAKLRRTTIKGDLDGRVTHMVIRAYRPEDTPARTMKLCKAIAARTPLVCWKWVEESSNVEDEWAPIEAHIHPLTWKENDTAIFLGRRFYFGCYNGPREKKEDLTNLVQLGGGTLVHREPSNDIASSQGSTIYVRDEEVRRAARREVLSRFEPPAGATIVSSSWILDQCTKNR